MDEILIIIGDIFLPVRQRQRGSIQERAAWGQCATKRYWPFNSIYMASVIIRSSRRFSKTQSRQCWQENEKKTTNCKKPWAGPGWSGKALRLLGSWVKEKVMEGQKADRIGNLYSNTSGIRGHRGQRSVRALATHLLKQINQSRDKLQSYLQE